jgi:hypothetical protein
VRPTPYEYAEELVRRLNNIDGITNASIEETVGHIMIEFHMPDQDTLYPSAINVSEDAPRITEATIRLGSLGDRDEMGNMDVHRLEGEWVDVVLDAATESGVLVEFGFGDRDIDLGDKYISSDARPHVRVARNPDGYTVSPEKMQAFIRELAEGFERQFGTFEERVA